MAQKGFFSILTGKVRAVYSAPASGGGKLIGVSFGVMRRNDAGNSEFEDIWVPARAMEVKLSTKDGRKMICIPFDEVEKKVRRDKTASGSNGNTGTDSVQVKEHDGNDPF